MAKQATYGNYVVTVEDNGSVNVVKDGALCDNTNAALKEIADQIGFIVDPKWNCRQLGPKILKEIGGSHTTSDSKDGKSADLSGKNFDNSKEFYETHLLAFFNEWESYTREQVDKIIADAQKGDAIAQLYYGYILSEAAKAQFWANCSYVSSEESRKKYENQYNSISNIIDVTNAKDDAIKWLTASADQGLGLAIKTLEDCLGVEPWMQIFDAYNLLKKASETIPWRYNDSFNLYLWKYNNYISIIRSYNEGSKDLKKELSEKTELVLKLEKENGDLQYQLKDLQSAKSKADMWFSELSEARVKINELQKRLDDYNNYYEKSKGQHDALADLQNRYNDLSSRYEAVREKSEERRVKYNELVEKYNQMAGVSKAIAMSAVQSALSESSSASLSSSTSSSGSGKVRVRISFYYNNGRSGLGNLFASASGNGSGRYSRTLSIPEDEYKALLRGSMKNRIAYVENHASKLEIGNGDVTDVSVELA